MLGEKPLDRRSELGSHIVTRHPVGGDITPQRLHQIAGDVREHASTHFSHHGLVLSDGVVKGKFIEAERRAELAARRASADTSWAIATSSAMTSAAVRFYVGRDCGLILWEGKRAANWSGTWIGKLASDARKASAACGVIVSETLPPGTDGSGRIDDVWISDFGSAVHLAAGLRWVLIAASQYEAANAARADTSGKVCDYIPPAASPPGAKPSTRRSTR